MTAAFAAGIVALALWMGVLSQHPIPTNPPQCPPHQQTIGALRCVDPMP